MVLLQSDLSLVGDIEFCSVKEMERDIEDEAEYLLKWAVLHALFRRPGEKIFQWVFWKNGEGERPKYNCKGHNCYWGEQPQDSTGRDVLRVAYQGTYIDTVKEAIRINDKYLMYRLENGKDTLEYTRVVMQDLDTV